MTHSHRILRALAPALLAATVAAQDFELECVDIVRPDDAQPDDSFGSAVSIDGLTAWITSPGAAGPGGPATGAAYVYTYDGQFWNDVLRIDPPNVAAMERSCGDVALSGNVAVLAHPAANGERGAAFVYEGQGSNWVLTAVLVAGDGVFGDRFGERVATDGTNIVVAAPDQDEGAAYVFTRAGATWVETQKLLAAGPTAHFGSDIAIDGDVLVVGADQDGEFAPGGGAGFAFERDAGGQWSQVQKLAASIQTQATTQVNVGRSVDVEQDTIVLGANNAGDSQHQFVWIFERGPQGWPANETQFIEPPQGIFLFFGRSVALDGNTLVTGSSFSLEDFVYRRDASGSFVFEKELAPALGLAIDASDGFLLDGLRIGNGGGTSFFQDIADQTTTYCGAEPHSGGDRAEIYAACTGVERNAFRLMARRAIGNTIGVFFYGERQAAVPFGDGRRCVSNPVRIPGIVTTGNAGGALTLIDLDAPPFDSGAGAITAGSSWGFQFWFRDGMSGMSGGAGFNTTRGVEVVFLP